MVLLILVAVVLVVILSAKAKFTYVFLPLFSFPFSKFNEQLENLKYDPKLRVLVIGSSSNNIFSAGADLKERTTLTDIEVCVYVYISMDE